MRKNQEVARGEAIPRPASARLRLRLTSASGSIEKAWRRGWSRAQKKVVIGDGAHAIIALRCCQLNGGFETYSEHRRAA